MRWLDYFKRLKEPELRLAWAIAIGADALQLALFPFFAEGGVSPLNTALDLVTGYALVRILGWHWALLPSFAAEMMPGFDLFPTWTAAVLYLTHERAGQPRVRPGEPEILPPDPSSTRRP